MTGPGAPAWLYLFVAGLFEMGWAVGLKYTEGFTRPGPIAWTVASMAVSLVLLAKALEEIPLGTGYAVWTGIGAAGTAIVGIAVFGEPRNALRLVSLLLIVAGVLGLRFLSADVRG